MDKIAGKLDIDVSEEEVNGYIANLAVQRGQRPERLREQMMRDGSLGQFKLQVREEKCIAKLLESAKITEVKPKDKVKKTAKTAKKENTRTKKDSSGSKRTTKKKANQ